MKDELMPLTMVSPGREVTLISMAGGRDLKARLTDMGLNEGTKLKVLHSRQRGPCIILIGNARLILGHGMAQKTLVQPAGDRE